MDLARQQQLVQSYRLTQQAFGMPTAIPPMALALPSTTHAFGMGSGIMPLQDPISMQLMQLQAQLQAGNTMSNFGGLSNVGGMPNGGVGAPRAP